MFSTEVVSTSVVMSMGTVLSQQRLSKTKSKTKSMSDEVIDVGGLCKKTLMSLIKDALVMAVQV